MGGLRSETMRHCARCGRALEPEEHCECDSCVGLPKDGPRAACPLFKARSSWRGKHWIKCGRRNLQFESREARDQHYRYHCCAGHDARPCVSQGGNPEDCRFRLWRN